MKVVKAATVQLSPVLYSREGTVEKVMRKIHKLGQQGVQFVTFPEIVVPTTCIFRSSSPRTRSLLAVSTSSCSTSDDGAISATHVIGDACKQVVSIGVNERHGETLYNTQLLFDAD